MDNFSANVENLVNSFTHTSFTFHSSLREIHSPFSFESLEKAKKFLACLEYFAYKHNMQKINNHFALALNFQKQEIQPLFPYPLTNGQKNAMEQIEKFQQNKQGKLFLLQGDVGCGKTIVAINSALNAVNAGFQVAVLAPTQILAIQLFETFQSILQKCNIHSVLLISKETAKRKKEKLVNIQNGKVPIVIGTHAVFSKNVEFKNLGFVIIDEQHKFGVTQRLELLRKSLNAKCLLMTATPIPRTLAMSMYSGIEHFSIKEKPQNRLSIKTSVLQVGKVSEILNSAKIKFGENFKMYWVCPLIESESDVKSNIQERHAFLLKHFQESEIITVHGKMKESEINDAILNFKTNPSVRILLATTIVEVGIDVPNANIIVIESAETFGLASLHQLRGRVGRGGEQSYCILLFNGKLSQTAQIRLQAMKESTDGFYISEVDRKIRGSGNILGSQQSGSMHFTFFNEEQFYDSLPAMDNIFHLLSNIEKETISNTFQAKVSLEFSFT